MKSKTRTGSWRCSSIPTGTNHLKPRRNSKKSPRPTQSYPTTKKDSNMTRWDTQASTNATQEKIFSGAPTSTPSSATWASATSSEPSSEEDSAAAFSRGQDLGIDIEISLEEAAKGTEKEIEIPRTEKCDVCGGSGAAPGTKVRTCTRCGGAGKVQTRRSAGFATFVQVTPCPTCRGKGKLIETPCPNCRGSGVTRKRRKITIGIPVGIDDGYQLRLRGEGEMVPNGGEPGDLYVMVHFRPNELFVREGDDLLHVLIISYPMAALGGEVMIPTLDGEEKVKIHSGTQVGDTIRLRGKGMPRFRSYGKGDLLVRVGIEVPKKLTSKQRALLGQLSEEMGEGGKPKSHRFHL